jgi:hypothetical protein
MPMFLLLKDLSRLWMDLLVCDLSGIPAAAQSLHQIHGADHLLPAQLSFEALAVE